jgi:hypothetical protein
MERNTSPGRLVFSADGERPRYGKLSEVVNKQQQNVTTGIQYSTIQEQALNHGRSRTAGNAAAGRPGRADTSK